MGNTDDIGALRVGEIAALYIRPAYHQIRIEAVGYDWAVGRSIDHPERTYLINRDEQWTKDIEGAGF
jgi:hypothetical protein